MQKSILKKIILASNLPKCRGFIKKAFLLGLYIEAFITNSTLKKKKKHIKIVCGKLFEETKKSKWPIAQV